MQLLDFSAGLPSPEAIRRDGYGGVIGYFSERRPGAAWMLAKPLRKDYCDRLRNAGLEIVTNYQFGKGETADWRGGEAAGRFHAEKALRYHFEAGGPGFRPLYAPVDDNPSDVEIRDLVIPFLRGWASVVGLEWTGVYANPRTATAARDAGVAKWFWIHEWDGVPGVQTPPSWAHMHQIEIDKRKVDGIGVDVNNVLQPDYGQWSAADRDTPVVPRPPAPQARKVRPISTALVTGGRGFAGASHQGIDFSAAHDTPIYAAADGEIIEGLDRVEGSVTGFSNWIWQDSQPEYGLDFIYGHMQHAEIFVRAGDRVKAGQLIALVGSEGQSTGPHLHFETWSAPGRVGGKALDPALFLSDAAEPTISAPKPPAPEPPKEESKPVGKPAYTELNRMGSSRSNRWGARITNILWHTQEGDGTAESLAKYLNNTANQVSYHNTIRDGIVCNVVDTDFASWSVLSANPYTINYCFAGSRASWSRERWLQQREDIRIAVWLSLEDCRKYGVEAAVIAPPYRRANGISDHNYVTRVLGIGNHTDVGPNFPWDVAADALREFVTGAPAPGGAVVPNAIAEMAKAASWLGAKITSELELPTPDGRGRYAHYENGSIYWTPEFGARPIPSHLIETYAALGWETGPLGFPVNFHTVLPDGDVQAFERGTLYRKYGQPGYFVTGLIGARWMRSGFEGGPYGWPVSNETDFDTGKFQDFEKGRIYWPGKRGTIGLLNADGPDTAVADTE